MLKVQKLTPSSEKGNVCGISQNFSYDSKNNVVQNWSSNFQWINR